MTTQRSTTPPPLPKRRSTGERPQVETPAGQNQIAASVTASTPAIAGPSTAPSSSSNPAQPVTANNKTESSNGKATRPSTTRKTERDNNDEETIALPEQLRREPRESKKESKDLREAPKTPKSSSIKSIQTHIPTTADKLAVEVDDLYRELRSLWRHLDFADRITAIAAANTLLGVLLPWVSYPHAPHLLGISSGGSLHAALASSAIWLILRRRTYSKPPPPGVPARPLRISLLRRIALWHILLGAMSTILGVYFLLAWGFAKTADVSIRIHFGFYWTLVFGAGLSYGGYARFAESHTHDHP